MNNRFYFLLGVVLICIAGGAALSGYYLRLEECVFCTAQRWMLLICAVMYCVSSVLTRKSLITLCLMGAIVAAMSGAAIAWQQLELVFTEHMLAFSDLVFQMQRVEATEQKLLQQSVFQYFTLSWLLKALPFWSVVFFAALSGYGAFEWVKIIKNSLLIPVVIVIGVLGALSESNLNAKCVGKFMNPVTDMCWECVFPIRIAGVTIASGGPEPDPVKDPICLCKRPGIPIPVPGLSISFWEPVRMVDVTRTPYCLVNLGGVKVASAGVRGAGNIAQSDDSDSNSFYQVHWYIYPLIYWLEVLVDFACLESTAFDLGYMTEFDPLWNNDEKNQILNPEAALFGSVVAQAACAGDCAASSANLPLDLLFWCSGCQGSIYPFTGNVGAHVGGVQASSLLATRFMAKLHRQFLLWGYVGKEGLCGKYPMPIIKKSQYRLQMTYPLPNTSGCPTVGASTALWEMGREYPGDGSDFGYFVWRKRDCCFL